MNPDRRNPVERNRETNDSGSARGLWSGLLCLALVFSSLQANAQNQIANPGFESNPPGAFGNNIGYPIVPWTLGSGNTSNVVKVSGGVGFNYGSSGPALDADPATGAGVQQHYLDIAAGSNDFYQSFTVPACGGALPGVTRQATFSGWFSTRDNLSAATANISIRQGAGATGTVLATASANLPAPVPPLTSGTAPWVQVSGTVDVLAGATISYVVDMDNNANFDQAFLSFSSNQCVPAQLTLAKSWSNAAAGDDATVTISRAGTVIDTLVSDAGSANETDVDGTPVTVYGGEQLVLAEVLAGSNAGQYNSTLACTGGGILSGNTLTVGSSGIAIVCTYTNTGSIDYGDAPDTGAGTGVGNYNTLAADNGASHAVPAVPTLYLGATPPDADPGTLQNAAATADDADGTDDEDDIIGLPASFAKGATYTIPITVAGTGFLNAWVDWNRDGDFADAGEQIATAVARTPGTANLTATVPPGAATGTTYARFRYSSTQALGPTGAAGDGEVEDYALIVASTTGLTLTKTNTPGVNGNVDQAADTVTGGGTTTYSIVVSNSGPDAADGTVLRDPASTGLTCTTATCTVTAGGATCPVETGAALVTALQSPGGLVVASLPTSSSLTFTLTCTVQ